MDTLQFWGIHWKHTPVRRKDMISRVTERKFYTASNSDFGCRGSIQKRPRLDLVHDAPTKIHNGPLKCFVKCFGKGASISSICWCPDTVHTSAFQWCFPHNAKSLRTLFRRPNLRWNLWWNLFGWIWSLRNIPENKTYSLMNTLKNHQKKLDCTNASTESWLQSHPFRKLVHQVENAHIYYIYIYAYIHTLVNAPIV